MLARIQAQITLSSKVHRVVEAGSCRIQLLRIKEDCQVVREITVKMLKLQARAIAVEMEVGVSHIAQRKKKEIKVAQKVTQILTVDTSTNGVHLQSTRHHLHNRRDAEPILGKTQRYSAVTVQSTMKPMSAPTRESKAVISSMRT